MKTIRQALEAKINLYTHRMQAIRQIVKEHPEIDNLHTKVAFCHLDELVCLLTKRLNTMYPVVGVV